MKPNRLLSKLKVCYYILTSKEVNENMTDSVKDVINSGPLWDICMGSSYVIQRMIEVGLCEAYQIGLANGYALSTTPELKIQGFGRGGESAFPRTNPS